MQVTDQRLQQTIHDYLPDDKIINIKQLSSESSPQQTFQVTTKQHSLTICLMQKNKITAIDLFKLLSNNHLSPTYLDYNSKTQAIIFSYIEGQTLTVSDLLSPNLQQQLLTKLKQLHQLTPPAINKAATTIVRTKYYLAKVDAQFSQQAELINELIEQPLTQQITTALATAPSCLIHNDLHLGNIIKDTQQQLWFIDWDEVGLGDPYLDLTELSMYLNEKQRQQLLTHYLERQPQSNEIARLELQRYLRFLLFAAWGLTQTVQTQEKFVVDPVQSVAQLLTQLSRNQSFQPFDFTYFFIKNYQLFLNRQATHWLSLL